MINWENNFHHDLDDHDQQIGPLTIDLNDEFVDVEEQQTSFFITPTTPAPKYNYNYYSQPSSSSFFFSPLDHHHTHITTNPLAYHQDHNLQGNYKSSEEGDDEEKNERQKQKQNPVLGTSVKWMSSKMRMMKKMMMSPVADDDDHTSSNSKQADTQQVVVDHMTSNNTTTRVCSDCNTTKTPLWRSGPTGPKSLCNACGIRQRKARRAAMAAAAAAGAEITTNKVQYCKNKRSNGGVTFHVGQLKKKCKLQLQPLLSDQQQVKDNRSTNKLCFEDLNSAFQPAVFPQDEKEAAILLMALSYGLVQT